MTDYLEQNKENLSKILALLPSTVEECFVNNTLPYFQHNKIALDHVVNFLCALKADGLLKCVDSSTNLIHANTLYQIYLLLKKHGNLNSVTVMRLFDQSQVSPGYMLRALQVLEQEKLDDRAFFTVFNSESYKDDAYDLVKLKEFGLDDESISALFSDTVYPFLGRLVSGLSSLKSCCLLTPHYISVLLRYPAFADSLGEMISRLARVGLHNDEVIACLIEHPKLIDRVGNSLLRLVENDIYTKKNQDKILGDPENATRIALQIVSQNRIRQLELSINETQRCIVRGFYQSIYTMLAEAYNEDIGAYDQALYALIKPEISSAEIRKYKQAEVWELIEQARQVIKHKYPQNRTVITHILRSLETLRLSFIKMPLGVLLLKSVACSV